MDKKRIAKTIGIEKLTRIFSTERKAVKWLEAIRWPGGITCPRCESKDNLTGYPTRKHYHYCKYCRYPFWVKTGMLTGNSNLGVRTWAIAIYAIVTARKGISSLQLSKELNITQKSAWFLLQRIRKAVDAGMITLDQIVEVDETYIGGKEKNKHASKKLHAGRGGVGKQAVVGIRERKTGRVVALPVDKVNKAMLHGHIKGHVKIGSTVNTDEGTGYIGIDQEGYRHQTVNHSAHEYVNGECHINGMESVWAVMKRGYKGVYHHWSMKHCDLYVNEFAFRLNDGNCEVDTIDRMAAIGKSLNKAPMTYRELIGK